LGLRTRCIVRGSDGIVVARGYTDSDSFVGVGDTVVGIFDDGTLLEWDSGQVEIRSTNLGYQARRACVDPSSD
jgi:hypothetical protein